MIEFLIGVEVVLAIILGIFNIREILYLRKLGKEAEGENLWLLDAITVRQVYLTFIGIYLLCLTAIGVTGFSVAEHFPFIRVINGALLLGVIAGPTYLGHEMRKRRSNSENSNT